MMSPTNPLTLNELIESLIQLRDGLPDYGVLPVHLLCMHESDHLITHVEVDMFTEDQGPVTSLLSWPDEPIPRGMSSVPS